MAQKLSPPGYADFVVGAELSAAGLQFLNELARKIEGQQTFQDHFYIATGADADFRLALNVPGSRKIISITTRCASGTLTGTFKINTTALGGTANAISSSEQTQAHTTANQMVAGDDLVMTGSANAACLGITIGVKYQAAPIFV